MHLLFIHNQHIHNHNNRIIIINAIKHTTMTSIMNLTMIAIIAIVIAMTFMDSVEGSLQISKAQWKDIRFIMNNPSVGVFAKNSLTDSIHEFYRKKVKLNVKRFIKEHPALCKKINEKDLMVYADRGFIHSVTTYPLCEIDFDEYLKNNIYRFLYEGVDTHKTLKSVFKEQKLPKNM